MTQKQDASFTWQGISSGVDWDRASRAKLIRVGTVLAWYRATANPKTDLSYNSFEMSDLGRLADCLRKNRFVEDLSLRFGKPKDNPVVMKEYVDSVLRSPNPSRILRLSVRGIRLCSTVCR